MKKVLIITGGRTETDFVTEAYKEYLPKYFPIVHPSPRNQIWMKKNPWYQEKVLPDLKEEVSKFLKYKEK